MSERKIPIYLECGYSIAMQVLGGKWKICIIEALRDKPLRPSLIFKEVPDATERVINQQLKELLEYKIIDRKIYAEQPPRTEYFLTDLGRSAFPILDALDQWGELYNQFKNQNFDSKKLEEEIKTLMIDDDVTKKKGIYWYVLTGKEKYLNIRAFTPQMKRQAYENQNGICAVCKEHFELSEMEADHITPWHEGGKTNAENCQMLCKEDNRRKSGK